MQGEGQQGRLPSRSKEGTILPTGATPVMSRRPVGDNGTSKKRRCSMASDVRIARGTTPGIQ